MMGLLSRVTNSEKVTSYDGGSTNAQAGKNYMKLANETQMGPMKVMISPSIPEVNPFHFADFAEPIATVLGWKLFLLLEQFLPPGHRECRCLPRDTGYHWA
jgi:hypothetical protein